MNIFNFKIFNILLLYIKNYRQKGEGVAQYIHSIFHRGFLPFLGNCTFLVVVEFRLNKTEAVPLLTLLTVGNEGFPRDHRPRGEVDRWIQWLRLQQSFNYLCKRGCILLMRSWNSLLMVKSGCMHAIRGVSSHQSMWRALSNVLYAWWKFNAAEN